MALCGCGVAVVSAAWGDGWVSDHPSWLPCGDDLPACGTDTRVATLHNRKAESGDKGKPVEGMKMFDQVRAAPRLAFGS